MRIERIDDKTVKCFLSNEELEEYQIDYKDFIMRSERAKEVVHEIMGQAEEEVGYKPPEFAIDLQIMMMPEQGLVITLSEKGPGDFKEGEQILECLRDMKQMLERSKEKLALTGDGARPQQGGETVKEGKAQQESVAPTHPEEAVFVFDRIGSVMEYATITPVNLRVHSALYLVDGSFCLHLQKGGASYERYSRACVQALEFGSLYTAEKDRLLSIQEHGECLIAEQALKKLRMKK